MEQLIDLRKDRKWKWLAPMDQSECEGHSGQAEARRVRPISDSCSRTPFS